MAISNDGFLVTLHLFPGDDLPQRWFTDEGEAKRYAATVPISEMVSTFGYCVAGREIEDLPLSITTFENGKPVSVEKVAREDFPQRMLTERPEMAATEVPVTA